MVTPRELLEAKYPEAIEPMDLCKKVFSAKVNWVSSKDYTFGNNPFPEPGYVWTVYEKPKVKRGN